MIPTGETIASLSSLLCLSLLHFLWQAVAIALIAMAAGLALRRHSAQAEYIALVVGLALLPATFAATLVWQGTRLPPATDPMTMPLPATVAAPILTPAELQSRLNQPILAADSEPAAKVGSITHAVPAVWDWHPIAPWLGAVYLFGVLAMCVRVLIGLGGARRLCNEAARVEDRRVLESLAQQCRRVGLQLAPPIAYCRDVSVPTLVGILRPTILLPLSTVSGLLPAELESILLHELVHIRRYDHLLNLAQRLIEAAFFFHPAVWFLSRRITVVREHCCDDAVLTFGAQRAVYIESLMRVAELSVAAGRLVRQRAVSSLHATDKPSRLRHRIARLLNPPGRTTLRLKPAALLFVGALLIGSLTTPLLLTALACPRHDPAQSAVAVDDSPAADGKTTGENKNAASVAPPPHEQPLHFSGIVVDKVTHQPISGAIVTILRRGATRPDQILLEDIAKPDDIVTDANGRYEFTIAAERATDNRFMVGAGAQGPHHAPRNPAFDRVSSILDDIKKGQHPWFEKIELTPGESVAAVIADPQGKPLANCVISFFSSAAQIDPGVTGYFTAAGASPMDKSAGTTTTDASGRFSFQAIKRAQTVVFSARPNNFAAFCHDVGKQRGDLGVFRVTPGTRLAGTVVDELGKPLGGIRLTVESDSRGSSGMGTGGHTMTDDHGRFAFEPVEDGGFQVTVLDDGRFMPMHVDVSAQRPVGSIDFQPAPMTTVRIHFRNRAGKPSTVLHGVTFDGWKGKAQYVAMLHWTPGEAEGRVPKGMERGELQGVWNPESRMSWRIGEHGDWKEGTSYSIPLEALSGDLTEITVIETKSPRLSVRAVGPDGKPTTKFLPRIQYKDPTLNRHAAAPLPNGVKGDVVFGGGTAPGNWITWSLQPDQEFTMTAEAHGYQPASQTLKMAEGETREITLKLAAETKESSSDAPVKTGIAKNLFSDISTGLSVALAADEKKTGEGKNAAAASQTGGDAKPKNEPLAKPETPAGSGLLWQLPVEHETTTKGTMRIRVVDADGRPVTAATIRASTATHEKDFKWNQEYRSDKNGNVDVRLPKTLWTLRLFATKDSYALSFANWESEMPADQRVIPDEFTFSMKKGTVIGGLIKNEDGKPIPGAKVEVMGAEIEDAATTDPQGHWSLNTVPPGEKTKVRIKLSHADYISDRDWGDSQQKQNVTMTALRAQTAIIVMHRGTRVTGTIINPEGKPVSSAVVFWGDRPYASHPRQEVQTDKNGVYHFPPLPAGPTTVTVVAQGWMPQLRKIEIKSDLAPVDFQLKPGKTLRIKFVDKSGSIVRGVGVGIDSWQGGQSLYNYAEPYVIDSHIPRYAANGIYEWNWAPDGPVTYTFSNPQTDLIGIVITADGHEHTQVLPWSNK